jgi:hypothetical protein
MLFEGREPLAAIGEPSHQRRRLVALIFGHSGVVAGLEPGTSTVAVLTSRVSLLNSVIGGSYSTDYLPTGGNHETHRSTPTNR